MFELPHPGKGITLKEKRLITGSKLFRYCNFVAVTKCFVCEQFVVDVTNLFVIFTNLYVSLIAMMDFVRVTKHFLSVLILYYHTLDGVVIRTKYD